MKKRFTLMQLLAAVFSLLSIICLHAQPYQFKSLPMGGAGFVSGIITSKQQQNLMYARTDVGGAYRWNATDSSWKPLLDWASATQSGYYGVESLAIDPRATNKLYMLVGINYFDNGKSAILKSDDYGQTFTTIDVTNQFKAHGNGMGRSNGERLQVDPNLGSTLYVGTRLNGLFKSTDAGLTWNRLTGLSVTTTPNGNGINFVLIDSASGTTGFPSQTIYVGVSRYGAAGAENLYKSTDGGLTFNPVAGGPAAYMPQRAVQTAAGDLIINYANGSGPYGSTYGSSVENMDNGGIYKFTPSTGVWANITPSGIARAWGGITVDPTNPNRMMASTINNYQFQYNSSFGGAYGDRIYLTTNGGNTWTDVVSRGFTVDPAGTWVLGGAIHWAGSIEFDPFNSGKVYITSGNGVFSNSNIDNPSTIWKFEVKGLEETVPTDIVSVAGGALYTTIGDYDGFKHTDLNQYGIRHNPRVGTNTGIAASTTSTPVKLVRVGSAMYISTDQGNNWTKTTATLPGATAGTQGKLAISANGSTILYCPNGSSLTYYSNNDGASWTACSPNISNAYPVADKVNSGIFYIYNNGSGNLNRTLNGGVTFAVTVNIGAGGNKFIRTIPGKEGHVWAALYGGGLKRSVDSGLTFTTVPGVTACSAIGYGKAAPGATYLTLYIWGTVAGVTGIFKSINEGVSWTRVNDDAHQFGGPGNAQFVMGDMNTYDVVYMSTVGRGVVAGVGPGSGLPVSIVSLGVQEADAAGKHQAQLNWKTATENNASHFTIERSTDAISWTVISTVNTKAINGNSTALLNYNYNDDITSLVGTLYYRLKMVDKDSKYVYSNGVSLRIGKPVKGLLVTVSPNPVVAATGAVVHFNSEKNERVLLQITSANGALIASKPVALQAGTTSMALIELIGKPSGIYIINVVSGSTNKRVGTVRVVISK